MSLLNDVSIVVTPNGYKAGELYAVKPTFALGSELVTNSIFNSDNTSDWGNGFYDSFTFDSSEGGFYNLQRVTTDARTVINLSSVLTVGKRYKVTVVARGSGNIKHGLTTSNYTTQPPAVFTLTSSFASYSTIVTVTSGLVYGVLWNDDGNSNIDYQSYSVKEYTSADMDVTRATAATRVDENGLVNYAEVLGDELVDDGNFPLPNTEWSLAGGAEVTALGGRIYSSSGGVSQLDQNIGMVVGNKYRITLDVIATNGTKLSNPNGTNIYDTSTVGSKVFYITAAYPTLYFKRYVGITDITINNVSVKEVTRDNVPRIDYTGGGCPHILSEPMRTNLIPYSEAITQANGYSPYDVTLASNQGTTPMGTNNATKLTSTGADPYIQYAVPNTNATFTLSVYAKGVGSSVGKDINFYLIRDSYADVVQSSKFTLTNEWVRYTATLSLPTNPTTHVIYRIDAPSVGVAGDEVLIWGSQIEAGSYATSYIPTNGEAGGVTRNQDIFTRDGIGSLINDSEGVLFVEMAALSNDGTYRQLTLSDGTTANRILVDFTNASNQIRVFCGSGGVSQVSETFNVTSSLSFNKIAFKYKLNDFALWVNGVEVATDTSGITPIGLNKLSFNNGAGSFDFYGKVKQLQVYNTALTDEQLLQLTGESGTDFYESYAEMAAALTYTIQ